jgi:hypothetical protein
MQKSTITYQGVDYVVRTLDITSLPTFEGEAYKEVTVADYALWVALEPAYEACDKFAIRLDEGIFFYADSEFIKGDPTDEQLLDYLRENLCDIDSPVCDANGCEIHKGDHVLWCDPETGNTSEYEVYEEPTEDMVKLSSSYGECEALPKECTIRMKKFGAIAAPEEFDFFCIENDGKGGKQIHILGYTYDGDDWKVADVCWFIEPLSEFVQHISEDEDYVDSTMSECKQYEKDLTDEECLDTINSYFNGKPADYRLRFKDVTIDTPCGNYVN